MEHFVGFLLAGTCCVECVCLQAVYHEMVVRQQRVCATEPRIGHPRPGTATRPMEQSGCCWEARPRTNPAASGTIF